VAFTCPSCNVQLEAGVDFTSLRQSASKWRAAWNIGNFPGVRQFVELVTGEEEADAQ
jgi:hypothetical protein